MPQKIILDTDIGTDIDDALALNYALMSPEIDLRAVTTVYGNVRLRKRLVERILASSQQYRKIKVHAGEGKPIRSRYPIIWHNGLEGKGLLSNEERADLFENSSNGDGIDFLINEISSHPHEYILITIGALTNLACALQKKPGLGTLIKHHYMMGMRHYNADDPKKTFCFPEHNIACDIEAADIVIKSSTPKTIIPANITEKALIKREDLERLYDGNSLNQVIGKLVYEWFQTRDELSGFRINYVQLHDPLTVIALTNPEIFQFQYIPIRIDKKEGIALIDPNGTSLRFAIGFDLNRFMEVFLTSIQED